MIKDVSKQYAAFFAEAEEQDKMYEEACKKSCIEAEKLRQDEIDSFDEEEISLGECGFNEDDVQVDEVVDPLQVYQELKSKRQDTQKKTVKVDRNYINKMTQLLSKIRVSKSGLYKNVMDKLKQYMTNGTELPPPEDFAENFIPFEEIQKIAGRITKSEIRQSTEKGLEDDVASASDDSLDGTIDSRAAREFADTLNPFGTEDAEQNLYDSELTEAERQQVTQEFKKHVKASHDQITNKDADKDNVSSFLEKNKSDLDKCIKKLDKKPDLQMKLKKITKALEKYSTGKLDESAICDELDEDGNKKGSTKSKFQKFIKGSLRLLILVLRIIPAGMKWTAAVLSYVEKICDKVLDMMKKDIGESLQMEVYDDEDVEEEEIIDEMGCNCKSCNDEVEESATSNEDDPVAHLLDPVGVKASTASLAGQDTVALNVVERLLQKIDKLENKIQILESRAEKNLNEAASSKSAEHMLASEFIEKVNKFLDTGAITNDSPVAVYTNVSFDYGTMPEMKKRDIGGIAKNGGIIALYSDYDYPYAGFMTVGELMSRLTNDLKVNLNDIIVGSCDPNLSNNRKIDDSIAISKVRAYSDCLFIRFKELPAPEKKIHEDDQDSEQDQESIEISSSDIENGKRQFLSGLDKASPEELEKVFDVVGQRILKSIEKQKKNGTSPDNIHDQTEVRKALKRMKFLQNLSFSRELTDKEKEEFSDLVYTYWYDWVYTEDTSDEEYTSREYIRSIQDALLDPFKNLTGFTRPGDKNPTIPDKFKIVQNGETYELTPFPFHTTNSWIQKRSDIKRKTREEMKREQAMADAGMGFIAKTKMPKQTWSTIDWNKMIGPLSNKRREQIYYMLRHELADENKDDPIKRGEELAFLRMIFGIGNKTADANEKRRREADIHRKKLSVLKKKAEQKLQDLSDKIEALQQEREQMKARLAKDEDDDEADSRLADIDFELPEAYDEYQEAYEKIQEIAANADEYAKKIKLSQKEIDQIDQEAGIESKDKRALAHLNVYDLGDMFGVSHVGYSKYENYTINMILKAAAEATGATSMKDMKQMFDMDEKHWQKFLSILEKYSDDHYRKAYKISKGDTREDKHGILKMFDRSIGNDQGLSDEEAIRAGRQNNRPIRPLPKVAEKPAPKPKDPSIAAKKKMKDLFNVEDKPEDSDLGF